MDDLQGEAWHKEMRRRSQDLIRVYNPTKDDFIFVWDDQKFIVPGRDKDKGWGKGMRVMQRYLAQKYTKEIVDKILIDEMDKRIKERKDVLLGRGDVDPVYNANQQLQYETRTDIRETREPVEDKIWLGIEEEFGVDQEFVEIKSDAPAVMRDPFERLSAKRYSPDQIKTTDTIVDQEAIPVPPPNPKKVKVDLSEVAR